MDTSLFIARFLGIYMLGIAALWLLRKDQFEAGFKDIMASPGLLALTGLLSFLLGIAIVVAHPVWELSWRGLITLFGYLAILQGFSRLAFPENCKRCFRDYLEKGYWVWIAILVVLGLLFTYFGFSHHMS